MYGVKKKKKKKKTNYINDTSVTDPKIQSMNYNKLFNIPTSFPSKTSTTTVDSNLDIGNYKFMKNGNEVIGLSNNSVLSNYINDNAVTDSKITSMNYNKLINVLTSFPSRSSTMTIDSDINMNTNKVTVPTPTDNIQAANKQYVDTTVANVIGTPVGCIMIWPTSTIPTNWLECNGQSVSQSLYPQLYAVMTTLPDLRGVFVRGFDNGRGTDTNRTLGSLQAHAYQSHTHQVTGSTSSYTHSHTYLDSYYYDETTNPPTLTPQGDQTGNNLDQGRTTSSDTHSHTINITSQPSGSAAETRPVNVALIYIIKAK